MLIRARSGPGDVRARPLSNDDALKADGQKPTQPRDAKPDNDHGTTSLRQDSRGAPVLHSTATSRDRVAGARKGCSFERDTAGGEDDDLRAIDLILREALGDGGEESLTPAAESSGAERDAAANGELEVWREGRRGLVLPKMVLRSVCLVLLGHSNVPWAPVDRSKYVSNTCVSKEVRYERSETSRTGQNVNTLVRSPLLPLLPPSPER